MSSVTLNVATCKLLYLRESNLQTYKALLIKKFSMLR